MRPRLPELKTLSAARLAMRCDASIDARRFSIAAP
jgi:hypothetical protein